MNILFYRYGSICEPGILNAFNELGHNVVEITEEITNKNIDNAYRLELVNSVLQKSLSSSPIQAVFSINYFPVISDICEIYKIKYCSLIVDAPVYELYSDNVRNSCNRIFTFDRGMVNDIKGLQQENVIITPLCSDVEAFSNVINAADEALKKKYASDIVFVGSLYSEKCLYNNLKNIPDYIKGYLDGAVEAQLKVYGYNFTKSLVTDEIEHYFLEEYEGFPRFSEKMEQDYKAAIAHDVIGTKVTEQERIRLLSMLSEKYNVDLYTGSDTSMLPKVNNRGFAKTYSEMPIIFHESKINLNFTSKPIQTGLPLRIFDVLGCGGFLITNYQEQLSEAFEIGMDLEVYSSAEELLEKVDFYLKNDEIREKIARNGHEKVKKYHTYKIRIQQMLSCI